MEKRENDNVDEEFEKIIRQRFKDKILVPISDYENQSHQTYKFLYEELHKRMVDFDEEVYSLHHNIENLEKENYELKEKMKILEEINDKLMGQTGDIAEYISEFIEREIIISTVNVFDINGNEIKCASDNEKHVSVKDLSLNPGVYGFKRPSWFVHPSTELSKENIAKKTAANTMDILSDKLAFWKNLSKKEKRGLSVKNIADEVDCRRRECIAELLESDISNDEKYIKYLLLTPSMSHDFMKTLNGAAELQINANTVIELLEQPEETFNKEMIQMYISEVRKATSYNLKKELADELIRGDWYITSDINGIPQKYQLVPFEYIEKIKEKLNNIYIILKGETSENNSTNEIDFPIIKEDDVNVPPSIEQTDYEEDDFDMPDISEEELEMFYEDIGTG